MTLGINVDSAQAVDQAFVGAVAAGAQAVVHPVDRPWGGRSGYVAVETQQKTGNVVVTMDTSHPAAAP